MTHTQAVDAWRECLGGWLTLAGTEYPRYHGLFNHLAEADHVLVRRGAYDTLRFHFYKPKSPNPIRYQFVPDAEECVQTALQLKRKPFATAADFEILLTEEDITRLFATSPAQMKKLIAAITYGVENE